MSHGIKLDLHTFTFDFYTNLHSIFTQVYIRLKDLGAFSWLCCDLVW